MTTTNPPEPQRDYAYIRVGHFMSQPIRVTVLRPNGPNHSVVLVHHPDDPATNLILDNNQLTDLWDEQPTNARWPGYVGQQTWAEIAQATYAHITRQRGLARRLTALGIPRKLRHYAKTGGTSTESGEVDTRLTLSDDDLDYLLTLAEQGKGGGATKES